MQLIGMLDSPYVRRVAISLQLLGLPFEHHALSVFRAFDQFHAINPVVKAPTLVCDDGTVLMDSSLILDYAERIAGPGCSLMPQRVDDYQRDLRWIGLALAACEKAVQIVYERNLRPTEKQHEPWVTRVTGQMLAAFGALDTELGAAFAGRYDGPFDQALITSAVAWNFAQKALPGVLPESFGNIVELSLCAELRDEFRRAPSGTSTYPVGPSGSAG